MSRRHLKGRERSRRHLTWSGDLLYWRGCGLYRHRVWRVARAAMEKSSRRAKTAVPGLAWAVGGKKAQTKKHKETQKMGEGDMKGTKTMIGSRQDNSRALAIFIRRLVGKICLGPQRRRTGRTPRRWRASGPLLGMRRADTCGRGGRWMIERGVMGRPFVAGRSVGWRQAQNRVSAPGTGADRRTWWLPPEINFIRPELAFC